jgi:hypothetical protein
MKKCFCPCGKILKSNQKSYCAKHLRLVENTEKKAAAWITKVKRSIAA